MSSKITISGEDQIFLSFLTLTLKWFRIELMFIYIWIYKDNQCMKFSGIPVLSISLLVLISIKRETTIT